MRSWLVSKQDYVMLRGQKENVDIVLKHIETLTSNEITIELKSKSIVGVVIGKKGADIGDGEKTRCSLQRHGQYDCAVGHYRVRKIKSRHVKSFVNSFERTRTRRNDLMLR